MNLVPTVGCKEGTAMLLSGELPLVKWSCLPLGVTPVAKDQLPGAQKACPLIWGAINWGMTQPSQIPADYRLQLKTTSFLGLSPCSPASLTLLFLPSTTSINHVNKNPCLRLCFQRLTMLLAALQARAPPSASKISFLKHNFQFTCHPASPPSCLETPQPGPLQLLYEVFSITM